MDVSYQWLRAVAPGLDLTPEQVAESLAMRGAPVEGITATAEGLSHVVIARVESVERHPDADRLSLCQVEGPDGVVQVICGAPNVKAGSFYPFVPVGSVLPGNVRIKKAKIRGVHSNGMLCSERELGLGRDHEGIMELHGDFEVGQSFVEALDLEDYRLEVEVSPNRGDLLGHMGVARELAPGGDRGLTLPEIPGGSASAFTLESVQSEGTAGGFSVRIQDPDLCFRFLSVVIRGVQVGPSPEWLASRLRAVGARPINNVVDATNYVMLELGHPCHAYDLDLLGPQIVVRRAREGESVKTLDGEERKLEPHMLVICDAERVVGIAGVMGGEENEVSEKTTNVLLECALFETGSTRATRRDLNMSTDASYRFERGVDPAGHERAFRRTTELIVATAGGSAEEKALDVHPRPWEGLRVGLRPSRVERVLGVAFDAEKLKELLTPLGFVVSGPRGDLLDVEIPGYRSYDVTREVDLIEEVARAYGYDRFPAQLGPFRPGNVPDDSLFQLQDRLRSLLVGRGYLEAQTPSFAGEAEGDVPVKNPISVEEAYLRRSVVPALVRRVEYNFARGARDVRLFETGTVFQASPAGELPGEEIHLAVVVAGARHPRHWASEAEDVNQWDLRGLLEELRSACEYTSATLEPGTGGMPALEEGTALALRDGNGNLLGAGGRVRRDAVDAPAWASAVWALEIKLPSDPVERAQIVYHDPPTVPGMERDLALIVPTDIPAEDVESIIQRSAGKLLEGIEVFDLYEGEGIPEDTRSIAFRLRYRAPDRTLTDKEADKATDRVVRALKEEIGVEARGR